ncbi:hypothetical protein K1T71_006090 [Dendrolimus kikuchii]|uniref:Uncharacterized protein n=1 Tax=Dendrolimus kikuchii TaxID=765133 RepID=A0ACC1D4F1_9NEOP|nr:hypothetical protein K1T71_006090 [Dendrolimus kikuchii]
MRRARSVTGPLRRAHPASGATWNVQVVRGKMSSQCLWHACRALSAGLLLMLLGGAMAVIGYYADTLSVAQEVRGNATVSVKDEARGFHLNNLSYAGPIVMGFGGFIVVAACVMTFEARDSAAKVTPARPQALPRPLPRRGPACAAPARLDQLGVYRLPHVLPLPHSLPLAPIHRHRPPHIRTGGERGKDKARFGSAPDLRSTSARTALPITALRRPLRRYALSVDEPPQSAVSASAVDSECGSQSSLALDLHASGACAGVTLRVRDNTRRRPLARQQRLRDDTMQPTPVESINNVDAAEEYPSRLDNVTIHTNNVDTGLSPTDEEIRASSAPPPVHTSPSQTPHARSPTTPTNICITSAPPSATVCQTASSSAAVCQTTPSPTSVSHTTTSPLDMTDVSVTPTLKSLPDTCITIELCRDIQHEPPSSQI